MAGLRAAIGSMFLITTSVVFGQKGSPPRVPPGTSEKPVACHLGYLPSDIQNRLKRQFGSWKVQEPQNLTEYTRNTWAGKKPRGCPGIAVGLLQSAKTASYAVLLVPIDPRDAGYRFLIFSRKIGQPSYETTIVENSNDGKSSNYFIRKVPSSRYFNEESQRKFHVRASEVIEMIDSAEQEYETDIYFWSDGRFRREPVDD
jgi:hypothetical protein